VREVFGLDMINKGRAGWGFRTFFEAVEAGYTATSSACVHGAARGSGSGEAACAQM
jgi:hypothetical protein